MHEILDHLPRNATVLDLGCGEGSFDAGAYGFRTVRVDMGVPGIAGGMFVQADATRLPFRSRTFDAVILNHCIEHFARLKPSLQEIGRVLKADGAVFASVPDAWTLTDRVYRKVFRNAGGHVNLFASRPDLEEMLAWYFGVELVATRTLHSGFTFLNRKNIRRNRSVRAQVRFGGFPEPVLAALTAILRFIDRSFGTRLSVYGWAFYFGRVPEAVSSAPMWNVCVRCGCSRSLAEIAKTQGREPKGNLIRYVCVKCGAGNFALSDAKQDSGA
jgi:SAM-dependent methyltransferase